MSGWKNLQMPPLDWQSSWAEVSPPCTAVHLTPLKYIYLTLWFIRVFLQAKASLPQSFRGDLEEKPQWQEPVRAEATTRKPHRSFWEPNFRNLIFLKIPKPALGSLILVQYHSHLYQVFQDLSWNPSQENLLNLGIPTKNPAPHQSREAHPTPQISPAAMSCSIMICRP